MIAFARLTATPAAHAMAIFHETSWYTMEEAIAEGYLVDYDVVKIRSVAGRISQRNWSDCATAPNRTIDKLEDEREFDASKSSAR